MTQMLLSRLTMALDGFAELKAVDKTTPAQHARHIDGDRILVWLPDFASSRPCSPSSDTNSIDIQLFETERPAIFKVFTCFPMPPVTGNGHSATTSICKGIFEASFPSASFSCLRYRLSGKRTCTQPLPFGAYCYCPLHFPRRLYRPRDRFLTYSPILEAMERLHSTSLCKIEVEYTIRPPFLWTLDLCLTDANLVPKIANQVIAAVGDRLDHFLTFVCRPAYVGDRVRTSLSQSALGVAK